MELERIVRILRSAGHPEAQAVDLARRILAVHDEPAPEPAATAHLVAA